MHVLDFKTKSVQSLVQNQENIFALTSLHVAKANCIFTLDSTETTTGTGNKWTVGNCVEAFTLHLNQDNRGAMTVPHCTGPVPCFCFGPGSTQCQYIIKM